MSDSTYLRELAHRCQRLSQACFDLSISQQLRLLADELLARADEARSMLLRRPEAKGNDSGEEEAS